MQSFRATGKQASQLLQLQQALGPQLRRSLHTAPAFRSGLRTWTSSTSSTLRTPTRRIDYSRIRNLFARQQRRLLSDAKGPSTSSASGAAKTPPPPASDTSLSGRLKKLSREYGWTAVGVYLMLSALDFPFCFLAVRWLGTERVGQWEHAVVEFVKRAIPFQWPERWGGQSRLTRQKEEAADDAEAAMGYDHGVKAAQEQVDSDSATLWTQLALAYAIHKSFIFIRVPLTAAVLPKFVKTLRGWGWNIGKRTPKADKVAARAVDASKKV